MLKRIISVLLLAFVVFSAVPFVASADETFTQTISRFNGTRGQDQLVVYTNAGKYTGTNMYGYEVIVTNGIVTSVGGNNNYIPSSDGSGQSFVVSGHGTMATWLQENVVVGMKASYQMYSYKVTFVLDAQSHKYIVDSARSKAVAAKNYAASACLIYEASADSRFAAAEIRYNALSSSINEAEARALAAEYTEITSLYREREVSEYRGLWLRPKQKSASEVEQYVRRCYENGINLICIETYYDSTMICPMPSGSLFEHNPSFNGFDVLGAFEKACHRYGIELHCWMPVFFSGFNTDTYYSRCPAYKKPEWQLKTNKGSALYSGETSGMVFLNPALSEVQDFLLETYEYLLNTYDLDGFQLDYIRYRDRTTTDDYGYDSATIAAFQAAYPAYKYTNITYSTSASYWSSWVSFRASMVTQFVQKMRNLIDTVAPGVALSADVTPDMNTGYNNLYQNASYWLENDWLDMIHPMAYGESTETYVAKFFNYADEGCMVIPGLGIFMDEFDADNMLDQTQKMVDVGCNGVIFFESETFYSKKVGDLLTETIYTEYALPPALNNANTIEAILNRMAERVQKAYDTGIIDWQLWNDMTWAISVPMAELSTNAHATAEHISRLLVVQINQYMPAGDLKDRLLKDCEYANAAALRDQGIDVPEEGASIDNTIPKDAEGVTQLIIDKINGTITGEDTSLITKTNTSSFNLRYAYVMLLQPVTGKHNVYRLIEAHTNAGYDRAFSTTRTEDMIILAVHSDDASSGAARKKLAKSIAVGTDLVLYGVDLEEEGFTSLNAMLYLYTEPETEDPENPDNPDFNDPDDPDAPPVSVEGDVNDDGIVDLFDYLMVKSAYFDIITLTEKEFSRCDLNSDGKIDIFDYLQVKAMCFE